MKLLIRAKDSRKDPMSALLEWRSTVPRQILELEEKKRNYYNRNSKDLPEILHNATVRVCLTF